MSKSKLPPLSEVLALAEQADCCASINDLARMHKHGEMSAAVVDALWPDESARVKAIYQGLTRYNDTACKKCGSTLRMVGNGRCWACHKVSTAKWRMLNITKSTRDFAKWQAKNREYRNTYNRALRTRKQEQAA
jgi:hypothetical protein